MTRIYEKIRAISMTLLLFPSAGCVKVADMVPQIPSLFIVTYIVVFIALKHRRVTVFVSSILLFLVLLVLYLLLDVSNINRSVSSYLSFFLIQIIPWIIYSWIATEAILFLRRRITGRRAINPALVSFVSVGIVLLVYLGFLFSGFCCDCYITHAFQNIFGWPFNLLDMIPWK